MSLINTHFTGLKSLSIQVSGAWQANKRRNWAGTATSNEAIVALVFCKVGDTIEWCKSERGNPNGQPINLLLGPYDSLNLDVHVNFSIGGGHVVSRCITPSSIYMPELEIQNTTKTGVIVKTFTVEGSQIIELYSLFIAATDVKVGRNGLWHLRKEHRERLQPPFAEILTYGRTGKFVNT